MNRGVQETPRHPSGYNPVLEKVPPVLTRPQEAGTQGPAGSVNTSPIFEVAVRNRTDARHSCRDTSDVP